MKKLLSLLLAVVMILSLCTVAFAADTTTATVTPVLPTGSSVAAAPSNVNSIKINGDTAVYHTDSNGVTYIRAIDNPDSNGNGGTEWDLKNAIVEIRASAELSVVMKNYANTTVQFDETEDEENQEYVYTFEAANLFNKTASLNIGSSPYTVAAGLPGGDVAVDAADPLAVSNVTIGGATGTVSATNVQNPYIGNAAKSGGEGWTFITYKIDASMSEAPTSRSNVPASLTLATDATVSGCYTGSAMNLSAASPKMVVTNNGASRTYYVFATDSNTFKVSYGIDFTEAKKSSAYTGTVKTDVDKLQGEAAAFFGGKGYGTITVTKGQTAMDIMRQFALAYGYGEEVPEGCTYMATLNGLGTSTFGSTSGWMYTDAPNWDDAATNEKFYESWNTPPVGAADYTLTSSSKICWFICTNYMHHPWG